VYSSSLMTLPCGIPAMAAVISMYSVSTLTTECRL
jgi:hypothetical protein